MKFRILLSLCAILAIAVGVSAAVAAPTQSTCGNATLAPGTYDGLTVTGDCVVTGSVTIDGNVRVLGGAYLDAAYLGTRLTINGNTTVGRDAKLGLGCTFGYHDCGLNPSAWVGNVVANGNIVANQARTMFIDFTTVHGNIVSNGGGDITDVDTPTHGGLVLPIKDNVVDGNIIVHGWKGAWFGIIRNTVGGNVIAIDTVGTRTAEDDPTMLDSTEIVTNTIGGNLICLHNTPVTQIGDSGGTTNTVSGNKIGECARNGL
jgi:hypothetical protein